MAPKSAAEFKTIRQKSKQNIIAAALSLFGNQGFRNTTISAIAKEAGISKGLLYNYFKNKEDLLKEIIHGFALHNFKLIEKIKTKKTPLEQLHLYLDFCFLLIEKETALCRMMIGLVLQKQSFEVIQLSADDIQKKNIEFVGNILTKLKIKNPIAEAYLMGSTLDGLSLHYLFFEKDKRYPWEKIKSQFIEETLKKYTQ